MNEKPTPMPEGDLIRSALKSAGLSARRAAELAGLSEGRWRQIANGYQVVAKGTHVPVTGPPETIASMARVVGVTPDQLREAGRQDAAASLEEKLRGQGGADPLAASDVWWDDELVGPGGPLYEGETLRWRDESNARGEPMRTFQMELEGVQHGASLDPGTAPEEAAPRLRAALADRVMGMTQRLMGRPQQRPV